MVNNNLPFPQNDEEANNRFQKYRSTDPFPEIIPSLLNSADIYDYVAVTGMIYPFNPEKLKSASYEISILGKLVYWDKDGKEQSQDLKKGEKFILRQNSIAFVTVEPTFQLPDYIALRFNLKITNVYRGILLGTGPLVDPGFTGKLSIPLHNLTTNDYTFTGGEGLIWMEFTKISPNPRWLYPIQSFQYCRQGQYKEFRNEPMHVEGYLLKADPHRPIRSSLPEIILRAKESAEKAKESAKESAEKANSIQKRVTIGGIIGGLIAAGALYFAFNGLLAQVNSLVQDSVNYVGQQNNKLNSIDLQKTEIKNLKAEIEKLKNEVIKLKKGR